MAEQLRTAEEIRETVRAVYAEAARTGSCGKGGCCGSPGADSGSCGSGADSGSCGPPDTDRASHGSLSCGNPTAVAELAPGETVLDLGSGGGIDVLLSARRVGPTGRAYGLDMTDEMLELARRNQREAGVDNVEWLKGTIEQIPLPDASIDVIISNCVINLSADKPRVFGEAARVLRPGGRFAVADIVADPGMDEATRADLARWTGCIAGALTEDEFRRGLESAGFREVQVQPTHRVHEHAASAIVRARRPAPAKA